MPIIDQKDVSPDEAILLGHCPECGQALIPKNAVAHAASKHWGNDPNDPKLSEEGRRRYKLVIDFAAARYNPALEEQDHPPHPRKGMPPPNQIEPSVSEHDTRPFWIDPVIAAVLFAQGLNMLFSEQRVWGLPSWLFGVVLSAAGAGWLWYHRTERAAMTADRRVPDAWALALIVVATIVTGYDIYDRHSKPVEDVPFIVSVAQSIAKDDLLTAGQLWVQKQPQEVVSEGDFRNQTVQLDGRNLVNCTIGNTIFTYKGILPTAVNCMNPKMEPVSVSTENPIVKEGLSLGIMVAQHKCDPGATFEMRDVPDLPPVKP